MFVSNLSLALALPPSPKPDAGLASSSGSGVPPLREVGVPAVRGAPESAGPPPGRRSGGPQFALLPLQVMRGWCPADSGSAMAPNGQREGDASKSN